MTVLPLNSHTLGYHPLPGWWRYHYSHSHTHSSADLSYLDDCPTTNLTHYDTTHCLDDGDTTIPTHTHTQVPTLVTWMTVLPLTSHTLRYHPLPGWWRYHYSHSHTHSSADLSYLDDCPTTNLTHITIPPVAWMMEIPLFPLTHTLKCRP